MFSNSILTIASDGVLTSTNSTFSGINFGNNTNLHLYNTIVANDSNCGSIVTSSSHNLVELSSAGCGLTNGVNGNIVGSYANLITPIGYPGSLALDMGSPAIDAGDDTVCASDPINNTSQNGVLRAQGDHCDIGAYEASPSPSYRCCLGQFNWKY